MRYALTCVEKDLLSGFCFEHGVSGAGVGAELLAVRPQQQWKQEAVTGQGPEGCSCGDKCWWMLSIRSQDLLLMGGGDETEEEAVSCSAKGL